MLRSSNPRFMSIRLLLALLLLLFLCSLQRVNAIGDSPPHPSPSSSSIRTDAFSELDSTSIERPTSPSKGGHPQQQQHFSLDNFAHSLRIEKDHQDPSRLLNVFLPQQHSPFVYFRQFIARVTDISIVEESRMRDANRTFLASLADSSTINVHGLSPGHKYSVAILGRREAESTLIREDQVLMDPVPLDLGVPGNSSAIQATATNITMRAQKPDRALQDTFRVEYHQLDPLKRFPILDVHDIQEQRGVELYLGNLSPGRDYAVSVTSLREELPSQPWRGVVTTRPLRPGNLSITELNAHCVLFSWLLPPDSGADRFKIAYGMLHGPNSMLKLETNYPTQQVELCQHIVPGRVFIFAVIAEKSRQISEPATLSHTIRPLAPRELRVDPNFEKARFRVRAHLASGNESHTEKCQFWVEPEQGGRMEQIVSAQGEHCEALFELVPGRRYEISAAALSGQSASTRVLRNKAVEPGFDFAAFGLTLREGDGGGTLRLEWPQSEVARLRIADLWARIVGRDSHLHFSVQPLDGDVDQQQQQRQVETGPTEPEPVVVEDVKQGECYKVLLYTVTSSGIVSEQRFEQYIRTSAPQLDLAVGQLAPRSATLQAFLYRPKRANGTTAATAPSISTKCRLHVVVSDDQTSELLLDRSLPLHDQRSSPSVELEGLRPWHKYMANAQVNCGDNDAQHQGTEHLSSSPCLPKVHQLNKLEFRTQPAQPGPIGNFTVRPLNSYSAQLRWLAPEEPNGRISHYIVQVEPQSQQHEPLDAEEQRFITQNVPHPGSILGTAATGPTDSVSELSVDGGTESMLPQGGPLQVEHVLDGLAGGRRYRIQVWPVNEAGQGKGSGPMELDTPISAPPRPSQRIVEVLADSVRSQQLRVRFDTSLLSERNGRLVKAALVVAETDETGQVADDEEEEEGEDGEEEGRRRQIDNKTQMTTWGMARRVPGRWPPFIAVETVPDDGHVGEGGGQQKQQQSRFGRKVITQLVGNEEGCADRPATSICNGPLKAGTMYRLKLRIFTAPHIWTDSPYSEPIRMEPSPEESTFGPVLVLLFVASALLGVVTVLVYTRQRRRRHKAAGTSSSFCHPSRGCPSSSSSSFATTAKFPRQSHTNHHHHHRRRQHPPQQSSPSSQAQAEQQRRRNRESQWAVLKMMMAERAADCLAKLGLDASAASTSAGDSGADLTDATSVATTNNIVVNSQQSPTHQQQQRPLAPPHNNVLCGGNNISAQSALFGTPHHRRSKSLRERTGVDQRLERLPSGPQPGLRHASSLPWTVLRAGVQPDRNRPVQICDFIEHVRLMSADSDFRFSEEYEDLRTIGLGQSCVAADLTANRAKNRFTNILPYDHSRVKLKATDDDDGSDYVNASYIPGFNSRREFIAAQGPLPSTRDHFWRLVWEQQVPAVVALTKCVEKGRDKCHQYWPDNSQRSVLYADIEVTLMNESIEYDEFTLRELRLTNMSEPGQPARTVQHLHYQAWPDFGVPDHPAGIVHFARLFRSKLPPSPTNKPTIVHCSAGVGRSGTFMALDRLVQHIESGRHIDVFGTVFEMRMERCHMVQNEQQYIFIHHCLQYVLENFYPFLVSQQQQQQTPNRPLSSPNSHLPFGSSMSSPIGGIPGWSSRIVNASNNMNMTPNWNTQSQQQQQSTTPMMPKIEVHHPHPHHQNDGFLVEDDDDADEGIAESGL